MSELSHDDIDALLEEAAEEDLASASAEGGDDGERGPGADPRAKHVEFFDFQQPHTLSKSFDRTMRNICESFAKSATLSFSNLLRCNTVFTFNGLKLSSFGNGFAAVENPSCIAVTTMRPLNGVVLLVFDAGSMFSFFTKLLGGPMESPSQVRDFTEIEINLARKIVERALEQFHGAAEKIVKLEPVLTQIENNPNYLNLFSEAETVMSLSFTLTYNDLSGSLNFFIPLAAFGPVQAQFDPTETANTRGGVGAEDRRRVLKSVEKTTVGLGVCFAPRRISISELRGLREGSTIRLGHPTARPLAVTVEGKHLFEGTLGQVGQTRAVRILRRKQEE